MDKETRQIIKAGVRQHGIKMLPKFIFAYCKGYSMGVLQGWTMRRKEKKNG